MAYIPIGEAVKRLGKSDRQVRRMVHSGKLTYRYAPDKKLEILAADVDKWVRHALPTQELERLDRLEQEIIALREQLDALSKQVIHSSPRKSEAPLRSLQRDLPPLLPGEALPDGYVPLYDLIKQYGLERRRKTIYRHMEAWIKSGHWNVGGHAVEKALDVAGIEEFKRRFVTQA